MKGLTIIAVTYGQYESLQCFINSIKSQNNNNNWELWVIHDGVNKKLKNKLKKSGYLNNKVHFIEHPIRTKNYGHILRKWGLNNINLLDYVLLTNGDNYYTPNMVNEVLKYDSDLIYFNCVHSHESKFNHNSSNYGFMDCNLVRGNVDMGCVAIKSDLAKNVGFNDISFCADWTYFYQVLQKNPTITKIDKVLFVHN